MGQDTYCVLGAGAPLAFTYENWPVFSKLLYDSGFDEQELFMLLIMDFLPREYDGCHDLAYHIGEAFSDFTDREPTPEEFQTCAGRLTTQLREWEWLPETKTLVGLENQSIIGLETQSLVGLETQSLVGLELQILAEIDCCHVRGLTRRKNPHIFNQESSWTADGLANKTQQVITKLVTHGLHADKIAINTYMWDSQ